MRFSLSDDEVACLGEGQALVRDDVLPSAQLDACRAEAAQLAAADALRPAGIGQEATRTAHVRGDHILWLEPGASAHPHLDGLHALFEAIREALNREAWMGLRRFELQLACYAPGARYVRHKDTLHRSPLRRVTAILYLNPADWRPEDGGQLELWAAGAPPDAPPAQALLPLGGRLVLFRSEAVPHAVAPTTRPRYAVTAWYRSDPG